MVIREVYPRCKSRKYTKNGHIHHDKQHHQCQDCGRQFVACFEQYRISVATRGLIERLLLDVTTRQIIAFHVGDRSRQSAKKLWAKILRTQANSWFVGANIPGKARVLLTS